MGDVAFIGSSSRTIVPGSPAIVGFPLDMTTTYRSGTDRAPQAIREASDSIETYSPATDSDLSDKPLSDLGDVAFLGQSLDEALQAIEKAVLDILGNSAVPLSIGGEHTVTLPIVRALKTRHEDFVILHLDAHTDLRDDYEGNRVNHATVMRRVSEIVGPRNLIQLGIRSGTREEFQWMSNHDTLLSWGPHGEKTLGERIGGRPVYLTLDLDVLDPACMPGTGNPEAGGWWYNDLVRLFRFLEGARLIGADVVELNPKLDPTEVSTITAAKIVRELLLVLQLGRSHG